MGLDFHASEGGVQLEGRFVWRLKLVQDVAHEDRTVAAGDVHRIFNIDRRKDEVGAITKP